MNVTMQGNSAAVQDRSPVRTSYFVRGKLVSGDEVIHRSRDLGIDFAAPKVDLNALIQPRGELPPMLDVPIAEIIDFLVETGERLDFDRNTYLQEALELVVETNPLPRRIVENLYRGARIYMSRNFLEASIAANFAEPAALDGWIERVDPLGQKGAIRAFPPRILHMLAGNSPSGCVNSIAQGALVKAVNLFKMPSSDPFTTVAVLRTMADIDPGHAVVRSMSAVYWRGGDERIERTLYRPQYFDKIAAWGGGDAISNVIRYLGPGLELVSFNPKTSISMIGAEAFLPDAPIDDIAECTASDATIFNQDACVASRFVYVEGDSSGIERFCAKLAARLAVDRDTASVRAPLMPVNIREEIEMLEMTDECRVWGKPDGTGLVILTDEPVSFHPTGKTVNVVHLPSLDDAIRYVNVATQTIGVYPDARKAELRDRCASAGGQRVVRLGSARAHPLGNPHDAMYPLQRFVHWMSDEAI
jgi:hypothetical protein